MKTVYADVVLVTNFCLDYILLYLSMGFLNCRIDGKRIFLSSAFGAVFALFCAVIAGSPILRFLLSMLFLPVMCVICVGKCDFRTIIRMGVTMYIFSFLLCGISSVFVNAFGGKAEYPFLICLVSAFLLIVLSSRLSRWFKLRISCDNKTVVIKVGKKKRTYSLMCDSGNRLVDPYVNLPVILLKKSERIRLLELTTPVRLLPVTTALGNGLAEGFTPDAVVIKQDGSEKEVMASVCFVKDENISPDCGDGILPSVLI